MSMHTFKNKEKHFHEVIDDAFYRNLKGKSFRYWRLLVIKMSTSESVNIV